MKHLAWGLAHGEFQSSLPMIVASAICLSSFLTSGVLSATGRTKMHTIVRAPDFMSSQPLGEAHRLFALLARRWSPLFLILGSYLLSPPKRVGFITPIVQVRKPRPLRG